MTENDKAEQEKFRRYLAECTKWDKAHDELPDWAPISDLEMMGWRKKQIKAHAAIYEQIYGEKP